MTFVSPRLRILQMGDPVLRLVSDKVDTIDGEVGNLSQRLRAANRRAGGVAIAAPQVGDNRRVFYYDIERERSKPMRGTIINPVIVEASGSVTMPEGCLSIRDVYFDVTRPAAVYITGVDLNEREVRLDLGGFPARVFQHELDHLDGILAPDRMNEDQLERFKDDYRTVYGKACPDLR